MAKHLVRVDISRDIYLDSYENKSEKNLIKFAFDHVVKHGDYECTNDNGNRFRLTYDSDDGIVECYAELLDTTYTLGPITEAELIDRLIKHKFLSHTL